MKDFQLQPLRNTAIMWSGGGTWYTSAPTQYKRGESKIKLKNVNKKRMATDRRLIFLGISKGIHC